MILFNLCSPTARLIRFLRFAFLCVVTLLPFPTYAHSFLPTTLTFVLALFDLGAHYVPTRSYTISFGPFVPVVTFDSYLVIYVDLLCYTHTLPFVLIYLRSTFVCDRVC